MNNEELNNATTEASRVQLHDYAEVRGLVADKKYEEALTTLNNSQLNESTRVQLQKVLESGEEYVIQRAFGEVDARIMQALCWSCWRGE